MIQDHTPIPIDKFLGLYKVDNFDDSVPRNYFIDELNTITHGDELYTRDGVEVALSSGVITKFAIYRRQGEAARILALISNSIWDLTTNTPILTVTGMTDFAINYSNNRAFISPHNGISGLAGEFVYVYNGVNTARKAGGAAPTAGFTMALGGAGIIEKGLHLFAWVFETDSGFVTGPNTEQTLDFDGTHAVDFSNIPIGPTGTAARRLIASRAIQNYNGNPQAYEMFFVPGGRIPNNTVTVISNISFYDVDLQLSADYVYDQLASIPAVVFICTYGKRMCYGGPNQDKNLVWVSNPLEPERVHNTAGFITCDPFETEGVKDGTEFRDNLFICKRNKTYTVRDNDFEPATWRPVTLDSAIGCDVNGIARYFDATGSRVEFFTVTSPSGLYKFTGIYEEVPLTRNIKKIWENVDQTLLNKSVTLIDQEKLLIYITLSLGEVGKINAILVGNFENGFNWQAIKWHLWSFSQFTPTCIGIDRDAKKKTVLKISSSLGNIYQQAAKRTDDNGYKIVCYVKFALINIQPNTITHIGGIGFRLKGMGLINLDLYGQDEVDHLELPSMNMACAPGKEFIALSHFQSEKAALRIETENVGDYFHINRINLYANIIFNSRPLT